MRYWMQLSLAVVLLFCNACATSGSRTGDYHHSARGGVEIPQVELRHNRVEENKLTTIATYRVHRQISMFYTLDLARDNGLAATMSEGMRPSDDDIRDCYAKRLEKSPKLKGSITLNIHVTKAARGISHIKKVSGDIKDPSLLTCITKRLVNLTINTPKDVKGQLRYSFDVVETVAQAAQD